MKKLRIGMLHLAPRVGDLVNNRRMVESAVSTAANMGADWIITPELCLSGYEFMSRLGTDWIVAQPDYWMVCFRQLVARLRVTVFLSHVERDPQTDKLHNTVFVIGPDGGQLGSHRKVGVVPVAEGWASAGERVAPVHAPPLRVGILVCGDAHTPRVARQLESQGAQLLVSPAAWPPKPHGPEDSWEARSRETGLPLLVCNRTGMEESLCFDDGESVVVKDGKRLMRFSSKRPAVLLFDWDLEAQAPADEDFRRVILEEGGAASLAWPAEIPIRPRSAPRAGRISGLQLEQRCARE